jgi:hypothetical protein
MNLSHLSHCQPEGSIFGVGTDPWLIGAVRGPLFIGSLEPEGQILSKLLERQRHRFESLIQKVETLLIPMLGTRKPSTGNSLKGGDLVDSV